MPSRFWLIVWIALALAAVGLLVSAEPVPGEEWRWIAAGAIAVVTAVGIAPYPICYALRRPLRFMRRAPNGYWLLVLAVVTVGIGLWLVAYQPTYGRMLKTIEFGWIAALLWLTVTLLAYDMGAEGRAGMGAKLGKSPLTGLSIFLTTIVLLFFAGEAYLRIFYITTDGYGFTAMNYHWYANFYWPAYNSLGFRDDEPLTGDNLTRIAVVGDSFAVGHGIQDMEQSFPHMLEAALPDTDVLLVANSGWDSDVHAYQIDRFPIRPDAVVLSYYLNDIDYLLTDPEANPDANFTFIDDPTLSWFVLNFFVPNYLYYTLLQYTNTARTNNFIADLIRPYGDEAIWSQHTPNLQSMIDWTRTNDVPLVVLVWPHLAAVEPTRPATARVANYFRDAGVDVIDMTDVLAGQDTNALMVNRFDAHPSPYAHRLAADALTAWFQANPVQQGGE